MSPISLSAILSSSSSSSWIDMIRKNPMVFNGLTSGMLAAGSDVFAQEIERRRTTKQQKQQNIKKTKSYNKYNNNNNNKNNNKGKKCNNSNYYYFNKRRMVVAGFVGIVLGSIIFPYAYTKLDMIWNETTMKSTMTKSLVEIFTVGIAHNSLSMTCRGLLSSNNNNNNNNNNDQIINNNTNNNNKKEKGKTSIVLQHVINELPTVTKNDIKVWLPYNIIAFSYIPISIRPTTTAIMMASWETYISLRSNDYSTSSSSPLL